MFSTSVDILNLVLALSVATLTVFISISIYYLISSIQKVHRVIKRVENGITQAEEIMSLIGDKIKSGSAYLMVAAEVIKQAINFANKKDWGAKSEEPVENKKTTKKKNKK